MGAQIRSERRDLFSMRVVVRMTGLRPDTIRKWEQRHQAITPVRTEGLTRLYSLADVRKLNLLKELVARGHSIGRIAALDIDRLQRMVEEKTTTTPAFGLQNGLEQAYRRVLDEYFQAVKVFDLPGSTGLLKRLAALLSPAEFVRSVALPALRRMGEAWERNTLGVAHEHFMSMQLRGVLSAMLNLHTALPGARRVVFATPEEHLHEFGILVGALLAADLGLAPLYLGANVPVHDILSACRMAGAELCVLSIARQVEAHELPALRSLAGLLSQHVQVWIGVYDRPNLAALEEKACLYSNYDDFEVALARFAMGG